MEKCNLPRRDRPCQHSLNERRLSTRRFSQLHTIFTIRRRRAELRYTRIDITHIDRLYLNVTLSWQYGVAVRSGSTGKSHRMPLAGTISPGRGQRVNAGRLRPPGSNLGDSTAMRGAASAARGTASRWGKLLQHVAQSNASHRGLRRCVRQRGVFTLLALFFY